MHLHAFYFRLKNKLYKNTQAEIWYKCMREIKNNPSFRQNLLVLINKIACNRKRVVSDPIIQIIFYEYQKIF